MTSKLRPAYSLLRASHESANSFVLQKSLHAFDVFVAHQLYSHYTFQGKKGLSYLMVVSPEPYDRIISSFVPT